MDKFKSTLIAAIAVTGISGCSTTKEPVDNKSLSLYQQKILEEDRRTEEVLSKAAALSAKALAVYVRTEQALAQKELTAEQIRQARFQKNYVPVNMEQRVQFSWDSAPEPLLSSLASIAGYKLVYTNQRPPISKSVTASDAPRSVNDYIEIIRQQTSGYIEEINTDDLYNEKVIKVTYSEF